MLFIYMNCVKNIIYNNNTKKVFPIIPNSNSNTKTPVKPIKSSSYKSFFNSKYAIHPKNKFIKQAVLLSVEILIFLLIHLSHNITPKFF